MEESIANRQNARAELLAEVFEAKAGIIGMAEVQTDSRDEERQEVKDAYYIEDDGELV